MESRSALRAVALENRYDLAEREVLLNGTQALVRLALEQAARDKAAGLNTAGYVTGYRGSPLGGVDSAFTAARGLTAASAIRFHPGVNEDLAATAIIGTQQIGLNGEATRDGVFALWYGKGPGVDRSGDAFHHGNAYGTAPNGGVLLAVGDDHVAKSSTTAHQSEYALVHASIPILHPATIEEIVSYGLLGWAMSRFSGAWVALKLVTDLVDSAATVDLSALPHPTIPEARPTPSGLHIRTPDTPQDQERRLLTQKLPAAQAFARANRLDRITLIPAQKRLGIVTTGKSWRDTNQALSDLGLDDAAAAALGIGIYKVGLVWPLEPEGLVAFADGYEELLVIEEKRPLIEDQVKAVLFDRQSRPRVLGKKDGENRQLLPAFGDLSSLDVARVIAARLLPLVVDRALSDRIACLSAIDPDRLATLSPVRRTPYFCSGCPHNSSTVVPEGSRAVAGIGCHGLAQLMERSTDVFMQMGGEGANWIGQAPFVTTPHIFQNLGDGTYFHSGLLAIRAAVAAKVNITYKLLFNDAVAMTGGQSHDGPLSPQKIAEQVRAEGVERIAVVSDDIDKYHGLPPFPPSVTFHDRQDLEIVQREMRDLPGVTLLIYDQICATEKRRRRKRRTFAEAPRRVIINDLVCEGCGDCSVKSNCLSVIPVETEWGRKRAIDQSNCNQDLSCVSGFCPSFVTVVGGTLRRRESTDLDAIVAIAVPPPKPSSHRDPVNILVTGIGGTGVVTIGAILAMAAHLEGGAVTTLDQTGLAQKGGQVTTHLKLAKQAGAIPAVKLSPASADLVIGADLVGTASKDALVVMRSGTSVLLNREEVMTGAFVRQPDFRIGGRYLERIVADIVGGDNVSTIDATALARRLLGDAIGANLMLVGHAWQAGLIPLSEDAIMRSIELNGAAVMMNKAAFRLGRLAYADPGALERLSRAASPEDRSQLRLSDTLDEVVKRRTAFLTAYQDARYAARYAEFVDRVRAHERAAIGSEGNLSDAVARGLFRLMAYKDEYEVARLYSGASFAAQLADTFEAAPRLEFHLAPPFLARRDPVRGEPRKMRFGPWLRHGFRLLAKMRRLRGTKLDPFGYTAERRSERSLIGEYRGVVEAELAELGPATLSRAVKRAEAAMLIRGYGHVKQRNAEAVRDEWQAPILATDVAVANEAR